MRGSGVNGERLKVVFIAGLGRNGGTLLDRVLGEVPGFVSTGELKFLFAKGLLRAELCNCGAPLPQCPFWSRVVERTAAATDGFDAAAIARDFEPLDRTRSLPWALSDRAPASVSGRRDRYVELLGRLHHEVAREAGARVVVNSSKFAAYGALLARAPDIDCRVVHLVRDSRAVAHSWARRRRKPEVTATEAYVKTMRPFDAALQYVYRNAAVSPLARVATALRRVRYEDFVAAPRSVTASLLDWLDEPADDLPFVDDRTVHLHAGHLQSGNPSRFTGGDVVIREDDEWRRAMPAGARRTVTAVTAPLLLRYGYPLAPGEPPEDR